MNHIISIQVRKALVSLFVLFAFSFVGNGATCTYDLVIWDTYGDGWDGEIRIQKDCGGGWVNHTGWFSVAGASNTNPETYSFTVDDACSWRIRYRTNGGLWPDEEFYEIHDPNGATVISGDGSMGSHYQGFSVACTAPTCSDGIQNQGETGIDCGGPCAPCAPSCSDGIQNQDETGVDCGGVCPACPTCNDGIQNQGENGIDCGGPCAACPVLCTDLGFENMASNASQVLVTGWELMIGRNNVAGPYTIESAETHSSYQCGTAWGDTHDDAAHCGIGGTGVKVYHSAYQHHDIETSTTTGINDLIDVPNLPNFSGSNTRCIRLGGEQQIGMEASGMRTTITINDPYLVYHYILRFENTGHTINNRGFCTFRIKDSGGNILPCGSFEVYENGPGETWTYDNGWDCWYMNDWKSVIMDVTDYIGQSVTIEVWVADCQEGAHGGWGYFDFECLATGTPDCSISPLPVELVDFDGDCIRNTPTLMWSTATEKNNDYFTIWHSKDGGDFVPIKTIDAVGYSIDLSNYSWVVDVEMGRTNYFKLSQTDIDGQTEFFKTLSFENCNKGEIVVYVDDFENIHVMSEKIKSIDLIDASGRLISTAIVNNDHAVLSEPGLSSGIYLVKITHLNNSVETRKLYHK
jgi:hypothetical protein